MIGKRVSAPRSGIRMKAISLVSQQIESNTYFRASVPSAWVLRFVKRLSCLSIVMPGSLLQFLSSDLSHEVIPVKDCVAFRVQLFSTSFHRGPSPSPSHNIHKDVLIEEHPGPGDPVTRTGSDSSDIPWQYRLWASLLHWTHIKSDTLSSQNSFLQ
jgi:hypothetical protein